MNLLEHYIIEVKEVNELLTPEYIQDKYVEVEVFCDCCGDRRIVKHVTTEENWIRELSQVYFLA